RPYPYAGAYAAAPYAGAGWDAGAGLAAAATGAAIGAAAASAGAAPPATAEYSSAEPCPAPVVGSAGDMKYFQCRSLWFAPAFGPSGPTFVQVAPPGGY